MSNRAKTEYSTYVKEIDSSAMRIKCEAFGKQLYGSKMEDEAKRNQLVEDALSVRRQITLHETLIVDLEEMLAITCKEIEHKQNELPKEVQMIVASKERQIMVGQNTANQEETQAQIKTLKLQLALKLSLESDSL